MWLQLSFTCDRPAAESLAELLDESGAVAVTFVDAADQPVYEPDSGVTELWAHTRVSGLFPAETSAERVIDTLRRRMSPLRLPAPVIDAVEDREWTRACQDRFRARCHGGRLWVMPSWDRRAPADAAVSVILDPGLAFGTGDHATTALCLDWLAGQHLNDRLVVDYGCGSGILAIAALKLGARRVWAVDTDPQALQATRANASKNDVAGRLQAVSPEELPGLSADLLTANILANTLCELSGRFASLTGSGARLALSGILREQRPTLLQAYRPWFELSTELEHDGWLLLAGRRRNLVD
jgi:ribosomal protein L11 methyltransferase